MMPESKRLAIRQLDRILSRFKDGGSLIPPPKGWVKTVRTALGMTARQLGVRAGMTQQAVNQIENGEAMGKMSIATMRKMADALECTFVYALVPKTSLEAFQKRQIEARARKTVLNVGHSMSLEKQAVTDDATQEQIDMLADSMLVTPPRNLWDQDD